MILKRTNICIYIYVCIKTIAYDPHTIPKISDIIHVD